jgi:hypothetical protein
MIDAVWSTLNVLYAGFFIGGAVSYFNESKESGRPMVGGLGAAGIIVAGTILAVVGHRLIGYPAWGFYLDRAMRALSG